MEIKSQANYFLCYHYYYYHGTATSLAYVNSLVTIQLQSHLALCDLSSEYKSQ